MNWSYRIVIFLAGVWVYLTHPRTIRIYRRMKGRWPNPGLPKDVDDKFLWRKVFDHDPIFIILSDKLKAKEFARERLPDIGMPRTLWVGDRASEIPKSILAGNVIIKTNHGSGYNYPIFNGEYDMDELEAKTSTWLATPYGRYHSEWAYSGVKRKLFVEELLFEGDSSRINEVKMYIYDGKVAATTMIHDRFGTKRSALFDGDWNPSKATHGLNINYTTLPKPPNTEALLKTAQILCDGFDHLRCDLYTNGEKIFFNELTVYGFGGFTPMYDDEALYDAQSKAWNLRNSWFMRTPQTGFKAIYQKALAVLL